MARRHVLLAAAVAAQASISIVQFGLPALTFALRRELGMSLADLGVAFAAVGLGPVVCLVLAGWLCDRIGAVPVLLVGTLGGAAGLVAAALAQGIVAFDLALLGSGFGSAAVPVAGMRALLAAFPPERRGLALGLRQMAVPLGGGTAALLLPALAAAGGIRLALLVPAALVLVSGIAFAVAAREAGRPGAVVRAAPDAPRGPAIAPGLVRLLVVGGLYASALGGVLSFTTAAAEDAGLAEHEAGLVFLALNVGAALARVGWGMLADGGGGTRRVPALAASGLLGAASCLLLPVALGLGLVPALLGAVLAALGALGFNGLVYVLAGELAGPARAGTAVGAATTVVFGMSSAIVPLQAALAERAGFATLYAACAVLALGGAAVARGLPRVAPRVAVAT